MVLGVLYSPSETAWIDRRAALIAEERGWSLPIARSEARAELARGRASGRNARILPLRELYQKRE